MNGKMRPLPGGDSHMESMRYAGLTAGGIVLLVVVALLGLGSFHIVPPGHRGISVTLGKVDPIQFPEGLTFKWPFIQRVLDFPIMQLRADGRAESFSSDLFLAPFVSCLPVEVGPRFKPL